MKGRYWLLSVVAALVTVAAFVLKLMERIRPTGVEWGLIVFGTGLVCVLGLLLPTFEGRYEEWIRAGKLLERLKPAEGPVDTGREEGLIDQLEREGWLPLVGPPYSGKTAQAETVVRKLLRDGWVTYRFGTASQASLGGRIAVEEVCGALHWLERRGGRRRLLLFALLLKFIERKTRKGGRVSSLVRKLERRRAKKTLLWVDEIHKSPFIRGETLDTILRECLRSSEIGKPDGIRLLVTVRLESYHRVFWDAGAYAIAPLPGGPIPVHSEKRVPDLDAAAKTVAQIYAHRWPGHALSSDKAQEVAAVAGRRAEPDGYIINPALASAYIEALRPGRDRAYSVRQADPLQVLRWQAYEPLEAQHKCVWQLTSEITSQARTPTRWLFNRLAQLPGRADLTNALHDMIRWGYILEKVDKTLGVELTLRDDAFYRMVPRADPQIAVCCDGVRLNLLPGCFHDDIGRCGQQLPSPQKLEHVINAGKALLFWTAFEEFRLYQFRAMFDSWVQSARRVVGTGTLTKGQLRAFAAFCQAVVREWFTEGTSLIGGPCWAELIEPYRLVGELYEALGDKYRAAYFYDQCGICERNCDTGGGTPMYSAAAEKAALLYAEMAKSKWMEDRWSGLRCWENAMLSFWRTGNLAFFLWTGETAANQVLKESSMPSDIAVSFLWSCGLCAATEECCRDEGIGLVERAAEELAKQAAALAEPEKTLYQLWGEAALRHKERLEGGRSWGPATVFEGDPGASVSNALLISNNHDAPIALKVGAAIHQQYGAEVCHTPRLEDACSASGLCVVFGSALAPELGGDFCALLATDDARRIKEIAARIHTEDREMPQICASVRAPRQWPGIEKVFSVAGGTYTGTILAGRRFADTLSAKPDISRWAPV